MKPSEEGLRLTSELCSDCKEKLTSLLKVQDVKGVDTTTIKGKVKFANLMRKVMNNVCANCQAKLIEAARR